MSGGNDWDFVKGVRNLDSNGGQWLKVSTCFTSLTKKRWTRAATSCDSGCSANCCMPTCQYGTTGITLNISTQLTSVILIFHTRDAAKASGWSGGITSSSSPKDNSNQFTHSTECSGGQVHSIFWQCTNATRIRLHTSIILSASLILFPQKPLRSCPSRRAY